MRDSSDDFFNQFESNSPGRRAPPPPPRRAAPPPPRQQHPTAFQQPAPPPQQQNPSYMLKNPSPPQQQPNYYGGAPPPEAPSIPVRAPSFTAPPPAPQHQQPRYSAVPAFAGHDYATPTPDTTPQPAPQQYGYSSNSNNFMQQQQPVQQQYGFANQQQQQHPSTSTSSAFLQGSMDTGAIMDSGPSTFTPNPYAAKQLEEEEPPLLEELGVNVEHIILKTKAVVIPFRRFQKNTALADPALIMEDADLAGPLALALLLGGELMMTGKLQFGYIYGFGVFGCMAMTLIMNLMSPDKAISFWTVASVLGYALLPVNILAALKILFWGYFTEIFAVITVIWSTTASTRLLEVGCGMGAQRYLLAYPIALLYSAFVLITVF